MAETDLAPEPRNPVLPCGCMILAVGIIAFLVGGQYLALKQVRESAPYTLALEKASAHPGLVRAIGTPFEVGLPKQADINVTAEGLGRAPLVLPLTGPAGAATLTAMGRKDPAGEWAFTTFEALLDGQKTPLDLNAPVAPPGDG